MDPCLKEGDLTRTCSQQHRASHKRVASLSLAGDLQRGQKAALSSLILHGLRDRAFEMSRYEPCGVCQQPFTELWLRHHKLGDITHETDEFGIKTKMRIQMTTESCQDMLEVRLAGPDWAERKERKDLRETADRDLRWLFDSDGWKNECERDGPFTDSGSDDSVVDVVTTNDDG